MKRFIFIICTMLLFVANASYTADMGMKSGPSEYVLSEHFDVGTTFSAVMLPIINLYTFSFPDRSTMTNAPFEMLLPMTLLKSTLHIDPGRNNTYTINNTIDTFSKQANNPYMNFLRLYCKG